MHASNNGPAAPGGLALGRMTLTVRARGALVCERRAGNMVLRSGAGVIAALASGLAGAGPIDTIGIGFAREPGGAEMAALTPPDAALAIPAAALRTALSTNSFRIISDRPGAVRLEIAAVFKPSQEIAGVTEAALLAGEVLYNQVIFEPVTLAVGQDVTFFWQIDFPFGH